jgi:hypothetical protein
MKNELVLKKRLRKLEGLLLRPDVRRSKKRVNELLAEDFHELGGSGMVFNKRETIQSLQQERICRFSVHGFQIAVLSPGVVLATYHSRRTGALGRVKDSLRSSIWTRRGRQWRMVFHQGTRCEALVHDGLEGGRPGVSKKGP